MLTTINLNDQHGFGAEKIGDIRSNRNLSAKLGALQLFAAQRMPKPSLGICHVAT